MSKSKKKNAVTFTKPEEPAFLRRIKEQIGYKEGVTIDTKRESLAACESDDLEDRNDERPTVVVLKPGDLSQEEAEKLNIFSKEDEEDEDGEPGKVLFKKPVKRSAAEMEKDTTASKTLKPVPRKEESTMKKVKNKSLLSFDDEEDDDN